ncbi:MAG: M20 family metallopeptidase [Verrucomicrobia bacterium]|nr:M20 family metallopeptidase [Verrucomicrobiota bacterium]
MPSSNLKEATDLLGELVACASVNPTGRDPEMAPYGEGRLVRLLANKLEGWGADIRIQEVAPGRPNLIAHWPGIDASRSIMFEAHSDTVPVDDMIIPPFDPVVRDGKLYGRGSVDTKGPMVAMLLGIKRFLDSGEKPPVSLYFCSACDEEMGASGARALIGDDFKPDLAIVGEPTDLCICHAHKGTLRWHIETHGVAVHSSAPERGVNAIHHMGLLVDMLQTTFTESLKNKSHPLLGHATISVGTIQGGTQVNVVPARCAIDVDRRLLPGEDRASATRDLRTALDALQKTILNFDYSCEETQYYDPFEVATDSAPCELVAAACRESLGDATFVTAPWSANAGVFATAGVPCVLFGPGSIHQAHTKDEYIELDQVIRAIDVLTATIRQSGSFS